MQITELYTINVCGIRRGEMHPDGVVVIEGPNETLKTSWSDAVIAALGGTIEGELLMRGEKEGRIVAIFDDKTKIEHTITEEGIETSVFDGSIGKQLSKVASKRFVKSLSDVAKVNPIRFMKASDKEKIQMLLDTFPFKLSDEQFTRIGIPPTESAAYAGYASHIDLLEAEYKKSFDERTKVNGRVDDAKHDLAKFAPVIIDDTEEDIRDQINELERKEQSLRHQRASELGRLDTEAEASRKRIEYAAGEQRKEISAVATNAKSDIQKSYDEQLAVLNKWKEDNFAAINTAEKEELEKENVSEKAQLATVTSEQQKDTNAIHNKYSEELPDIAGQLEGLRARRDEQERQEHLRNMRSDAEAKHAKHKAESEALTIRLDTIKAVKLELLSAVPLPGLEIKEGKVFVDGLPFNALNRSRQMRFSVDYAIYLNGPVMVIDEAERLDSNNLADMADYVTERGAQVFFTRVRDIEKLNIITSPGKLAAVNGQEAAL